MIDSEIINGELTGVIEPGSRAHVVLKAATSMLMLKKLTSVHQTDLIVSESEFRAFLRDNDQKVSAKELEVLKNYGLLEQTLYYEGYESRRRREEAGIEKAPYDDYTLVWKLGEFTSEVLQMLKDGDDAYVYC